MFIFLNQIFGIVKHIFNITSLEFGIKTYGIRTTYEGCQR